MTANPDTRHVIVTGADGYIGRRLCDRALDRGWFVTALSRRPQQTEAAGRRALSFDLDSPGLTEAMAAPEGVPPVDSLVHLAFDRGSSGDPESDVNLASLKSVLSQTRAHGLRRFVLASSVAARPDALNKLGRLKAASEDLLAEPGEVAARIGLVYGGPPGGLWATISKLVGLSPMLPMFETGRPVQPIHLDELCDGLIRLIDLEVPARKVYGLAAPDPMPFGAFLKLAARALNGRTLTLVPLPTGPVMLAVNVVSAVPFLPSIDRERVLGLAGLNTYPCADDLRDLGLGLEAPQEVLARESGKI